MVFNSKPKSASKNSPKGVTKVYYKNLCNILSLIGTTNMFLHTTQFVNLLNQAEDLLGKLKKSDPSGNYPDLENEYNTYKERFMKWQARLTE
jgi:hypothetical protein